MKTTKLISLGLYAAFFFLVAGSLFAMGLAVDRELFGKPVVVGGAR